MTKLIVTIIIFLAVLYGEIRCIVKAIQCNWEPIGKAEILYTVGACTGTGCIIGYFDIEDK